MSTVVSRCIVDCSVVLRIMIRHSVSLIILILCSGVCFSVDSSNNTVWKQIKYTGKHLDLATSTNAVSSPEKCAEKCLCNPLCKSFGINLDMTCSLYDGRVWAGRDGIVESDWFYYWFLEASCPIDKGYSLNPENTVCYKYYDQAALNWTAAQAKCQQDGGHLFMIDTAPDKPSIIDTLMSLKLSTIDSSNPLYLGATDKYEEGVWNWLNGEPVNRSQFAPNQPNNYGGKQHCLIFNGAALDDILCTRDFKFLCEMPLYPIL